jgi:peptide/nickel transport system substrate-binding protein
MRFAILGPVEVSLDGRSAALGGPKQRALLAILLLHRNEVVSRDQLIDALWDSRPPPSAGQSLDAYLYRLRKLLGHDRLTRQATGYLLRVEPGELDVDRFESLVLSAAQMADAGDSAGAARGLRDALGIWRGPALADVLFQPFAGVDARQLEERRLGALEERIDADLRLGQGRKLVPELERLVIEHPFRERMVTGLMLSLYQAGRQADALAAFRTARRRLADDLGLEPGPESRELERRILQHDPSLAGPHRLARPRRSRGRRGIAAAGTAAAVAALAVGILISLGEAATPRALAAGVSRLLAFYPSSGRRASGTALAGAPGAIAAGAGSVWVADANAGTVSRVDPGSGAVVDRILVGGQPGSLVGGDGAIWVTSTLGGTLERIDPGSESVTQTIHLGGANPDAVAFGSGELWVADSTARTLTEIDATTGSVRRRLALDLPPSAIAFSPGAIWVAGYDGATVEKFDPRTGRSVLRVRVGNGPAALALGAGALWVANSLDGTVSRVKLATGAVVSTIPVGSGPTALVVDTGAVWVANQYSGSISRIDPRVNRVTATLGVNGTPTSLAVGLHRMWVGATADGSAHRGGTLTLLQTARFSSIDPASYNVAEPAQFTGLTYDTLVTFERAGGPSGLRLVPDLALGLPVATDHGTVYRFRLRPGIRYSDGRPVEAADFRRAIERLFRVGSPGSDYYGGIIGAGACTRRPMRCDLSRGIRADDATGTVVFQLTAPDPDFLFKLTEFAYSVPVPAGTSDHDLGHTPLPGTGPYRIAAADATEVRFVRNPFFREWSHAAQPDGDPDVIVWQYSPRQRAAATAIEQGRADWGFFAIPPAQLRALQIRYPGQLHANPAFIVDFVHLNTHRAPFNDVRVRRALNYAVDRGRIAAMYGGPTVATPTCQPLAPGLLGYRRYCPYTLHPRTDGAWGAPDLARARRLVRASGTRGEHVDLWGESDQNFVPRQAPFYVAAVLRSLGYRIRIHLAPSPSVTVAMRRRHQLSVDGDWLADYPSPSSYIPQFFSCGGGNGNGYYCDPRLDRKMREASRLEPLHPARAAALWTEIDHQLTDNAGWVPTVNLANVDLVSARLQNYQYNPVWGFIVDQAWLR